MILCLAFLFAPRVIARAAGFAGFVFALDRADYGKLTERSNRNLKKIDTRTTGH